MSAQRGCDTLLEFSQRTCLARPGELFPVTGGVPPDIAPRDAILSSDGGSGRAVGASCC